MSGHEKGNRAEREWGWEAGGGEDGIGGVQLGAVLLGGLLPLQAKTFSATSVFISAPLPGPFLWSLLGTSAGMGASLAAFRGLESLFICRQKVPGNSEMNGYQLNLVWKEGDRVLRRRCLLTHSVRAFVFGLGRRYESIFGFALSCR